MHVLAGARDRIKYWQSATQELVTTGYEHYLTLAADGTTARLCLLAVNRKAENCEHDHDRHGGLARLPTLEKKSVSTSYPSSSSMSLLTLSPGFP